MEYRESLDRDFIGPGRWQMKAHEVIRPNMDSRFWDVPGTDKMVHCYRVYGGALVFQVIEPSGIMGRHHTITFLSDGKTEKCYGTMSSRRHAAYRTCRAELEDECYRIMMCVVGTDELSDQTMQDCGDFRVYGTLTRKDR